MARVFLVEPFYGGSHRAWADGWAARSRHEIVLLTLPDRYWRWRLRGAAVTMAPMVTEAVAIAPPDVVVMSSLVDAAALAGMARRAIGDAAIAVYMHESQLLYPPVPGRSVDTGASLTNWQSLVVADAVWFNSAFHREALQQALPKLLGDQPDPRHDALIEPVFARSSVLHPGVETQRLIETDRDAGDPPLVVWNQRWNHDKNPRAVFAALADAADEGIAFRLALAGENDSMTNPMLDWVRERLGDRIDHVGHLERERYLALLASSDVVVSAADHEFFGIAIVEAIAAGAVPVLPDRLVFPELIEPQWHDAVLYPDGDLRRRVRQTLSDVPGAREATKGVRSSMARFDMATSVAAHDRAIDELV